MSSARSTADRFDPLAGFELVRRDGVTQFRVRPSLLETGGHAVEAAVEAGFPPGTELEYEAGDWVIVLPDEGGDTEQAAGASPDVIIELPPAPGYEWASESGRPVLRLREGADSTSPRPALRPPGNLPGWRWRRGEQPGWVLAPPAGVVPRPAGAPAPARAARAPDSPAGVRAPEAPDVRLPDREPGLGRRRRFGVIDAVGVALVVTGLTFGAVLLLGGGGGDGGEPAAASTDGAPPDFALLASLLGVAPDDLFAALTEHDPAQLASGATPGPGDPLGRITGSALVLVDMSEAEAAVLAGAAAGNPEPGQQFVVILELGGETPAPGAQYRFALIAAAGQAVAELQPGDGDGTGRVGLRRGYFYEEPAQALTVVGGPGPAGESRSFAVRQGRYVMIGVAAAELAGDTVFGQALSRATSADSAAYMLTPPYPIG